MGVSAPGGDNPLSFKPKPQELQSKATMMQSRERVAQLRQVAEDAEEGVYQPPKLAAVPYGASLAVARPAHPAADDDAPARRQEKAAQRVRGCD